MANEAELSLPVGRAAVIAEIDVGNAAFLDGNLRSAMAHYERATRALDPSLDDISHGLYENLALARMNMNRHHAAIRAFMRALDGAPTSREQSLRFLIVCLLHSGKRNDALRYMARYEAAFGPHPEPWARAACGLE